MFEERTEKQTTERQDLTKSERLFRLITKHKSKRQRQKLNVTLNWKN